MPAKSIIDAEAVRSLATVLRDTELNEIEYETGDLRIRIARGTNVVQATVPVMPSAPSAAPAMAPATSAASAPAIEDLSQHPGAVTSPMVGVAYLSPEPGAAAFITEGANVAEGDTLLLIEAMKTFNPIRAPRSGKIVRIVVASGAPVEYGEPLVIIE